MSQGQKINWSPSASNEAMHARAKLYSQIRAWMAAKDILEVETPVLGLTNSTDIHLHPFWVDKSPQTKLILQTSPEFFMKRLLSAQLGSIYQICKAFRNEEHGRMHNPEFTMLEWYRVGLPFEGLILEVNDLLRHILQTPPAQQVTYQSVLAPFEVNPHTDSPDQCIRVARAHGAPMGLDKPSSCDYLFDLGLSRLSSDTLWVVTEFPQWQAALAKLEIKEDVLVARRFEFYFKGYELANGYDELSCPQEQRVRFEEENQLRLNQEKPQIPICEKLIAALEQMPQSTGVAMGLDRILMLKLDKHNIRDVIAFDYTSL